MSSLPAFIYSQYQHVPYPTTSFQGQTVIVTGANTGLGLEAARHFARLGASKVIIACRSISKGEEAASSIESTTGRKGVCEVWQVDLENFDSVKEFTKRAERLERLDVVCENAGIAGARFRLVEGIESTIAINVVGTFLMALNFLPILRKSGEKTGATPKLVVTTSNVHGRSKFAERFEDSIFDALVKNDQAYMADRYNTSKLLEVFFVRALAEAIQNGPHSSEPLVLNMVNPGLCHSSLSRNVTGMQKLIFGIMKFFLARTTEVGSGTIVAGAEAGPESFGKYMTVSKVAEPSEFVRSMEGKKTEEKVYQELMAILEKLQPGISKYI